MTNIFVFKPRHELEHEQNLKDFIEFSRKLPPLNELYDYESFYWKKVGNFTKFGANSKQRNSEELLDESILPFAKAYMVYGGGGSSGIDSRLKAIRAIEAGFSNKNYPVRIDITKLTAVDFNNATEAARKALGDKAAYQAGRGIANLHKFLVGKSIMTGFVWKNPIKKPADIPVGDKADKARLAKMPDENAIMALASVTSRSTEELSPRDINTTATMALMLSAPSRGSEPLYLLSDCIENDTLNAREAIKQGLSEDDVKVLILAEMKKIKEKKATSKSMIIDESGEIIEDEELNLGDVNIDWDTKITVKGLRWYSGKGYGHENKWLPTVMYPVIDKVVERLREQSKEAREFARMLEESKNFPRHRLCPDVPEDQLLTKDEVTLALGLDVSIYGDQSDAANRKKLQTGRNQLLKRKGIAREDFVVSLLDLNKIVRKGLPEGFPYIPFVRGSGVKVKWSQSLYAGFSNSLDLKKTTVLTELQIPTINTLNEDLAPTKKKNRSTGELAAGVKSIFQRWGFGELVITSHQLRHMLDTMAAVNGMDAEMRAKWAMRSDPTHNKYYDHTTPEEYGADFIEEREAQIAVNELVTKAQEGSILHQVMIATPRTIQELNTKASLSVHTTDFGMCRTSYMSEPCTKYRDCINCTEHVCIKGDDGACERIRQRLEKEEKLLKMDKKAVDGQVQGAMQFYERRAMTVKRFGELLTTMENPDIPDGSLVKLKDIEEVTLLDRAMDANGKKRLPDIINYQRLNVIQKVSVDELVGIENKVSADDLLDDEDTFFDDIDGLDEMYFSEDV